MKIYTFFLTVVALSVTLANGQPLDGFASGDLRILGKIGPRTSAEIQSSTWSVGAEMMDRDFTIYANWKEYLGKLGVKKARVQSGWAKCEKEPGVYDWAWLDEIIFDMVGQGVTPWVNLCYGNTIYQGGGGTTLMGQIPDTPESLAAWERYVKATVARYKHVVSEWEVWNEPNYRIDFEKYANFFILSAEAVKSVQPDAKILAFALGSGVDYKFADKVLAILHEKGKTGLIDQITHHRHIKIPEDRNNEIELEKVVAKYSDKIIIRQGEAGCPSKWNNNFALNKYHWTEHSQAKHILRRMLTDLGHDKETCLFTIMDAKYPQEWNYKGLLSANQEDFTVAYAKPAYFAMQHITSIFDDRLKRIKDYPVQVESDNRLDLACHAYGSRKSKKQVLTLWRKGEIPSDSTWFSKCNFSFSAGNFKTPVFVDMISGIVYEIPKNQWTKKGKTYSFLNIPVPDYPVLIADLSLLNLVGTPIGKVQPRHASQIVSSRLSIGAETMDRDFTIYENWKSYLGPLGFKKARIMSGWAKTEVQKGVYSWEWMDNIVNDMVKQGVTPWVTLSYGNPLYTTFKDDSRGDPPRTEEAWQAWENYVKAFVSRYRDKIGEFEIWNEPRPGKKISSDDYTTMVIRTANAIRSVDPEAKIYILALDHSIFEASVGAREASPEIASYVANVLNGLKKNNALSLVNAITYHPYDMNPDDSYDVVRKFRELIKSYGPWLEIIQGENGAPSEFNTKRALSNYPWTEISQAKWGLRRVIGDLGHNIPTNYFSMADMFYEDEINSKAILKARPDKTIERPKVAYHALQNVSAIFDDRFQAIENPPVKVGSDRTTSAYLFSDNEGNKIVAVWLSDRIPSDFNDVVKSDVLVVNGRFEEPVYVDMLTGRIYEIGKGQYRSTNGTVRFDGLPIPDSPVLIMDKKLLK